ncbi:unnamed protein product [Brassica rapa subsp. trilocularis]
MKERRDDQPCIRHEICGVLVLLGVLTSVLSCSFLQFKLQKFYLFESVLRCQVRDRAVLRSECYGDDKLYSHR